MKNNFSATSKAVHMIGNAHIDPVWIWKWQEGYQEIKSTFRSALDRMKEYPEFIFTCACAAYYEWIEENEPEMFDEIKEAVKRGQWKIVGGWWIQPDCNIPSGESFVRHGLYSQRYFNDRFGVTSKVGYNVDSFGHNGNLPQILKKSGMDYYVMMRPGEHEKHLPDDLFWWQSFDGSKVLTFRIPFSYNDWFPEGGGMRNKVLATNEMATKQGHDLMCFYGVGNHGGGPTRRNIEWIRTLQSESTAPDVVFSHPEQYFSVALKDVETSDKDLPTIYEDLQHHASGCYSSQSEVKRNNRRAELQVLAAEKLNTVAHVVKGLPYYKEELFNAWKNVMFNQFHDILGGCSIPEAYEDARWGHGASFRIASEVLNKGIQKLSWSINTHSPEVEGVDRTETFFPELDNRGIPYVVFNTHSWPVQVPVEVNKEIKGITDEVGRPIEMQLVQSTNLTKFTSHTIFDAKLPALGYRVYWLYGEQEQHVETSTRLLRASKDSLENDWFLIEFDRDSGAISKLVDKRIGMNVFSGRAALPIVIQDESDTWSHGVFEFRDEVGTFGGAEFTLLETGPLRARLRVKSSYSNSTLVQDFIVYRDKDYIECRVKVDWHETLKMLKLAFPVNVVAPKATYEIPYGFISKPANGQEEAGHKWIDVTGQHENSPYGLAIVNDSKYSYDILDSEMRLTVLRSPIYAHHQPNVSDPEVEYQYVDQGEQQFSYFLIPHRGPWQEQQISRRALELISEPIGLMETYHKGDLPQSFSYLDVSAENVIVSVIKRAENDEGYVVRCYESCGAAVEATISLHLLDRTVDTKFGPNEIKTLFIPDSSESPIREILMTELDI